MKIKDLFMLIFVSLGMLVYLYCSSPPQSLKTKPDNLKSTSQKELENTNKQSDKNATTENQSQNDKQEEDSPDKILEEALEAYQDARTAWDKADIDTALAALDEAYHQILQLKLPQDSPLNQEKNDLRLLIAQRIQEIYASHLIAVGENQQLIPLVENKYVNAEIKNFQTKEKKYFQGSYKRSGLYHHMMKEKMKKNGLPEELAWIPIIESGFKVRAYSRARALGLWQFISSTGYRFGLKKDRWTDERMDPEKATDAAIKYLKELHSYFGDWTTALASYNCGEFRVQRVIRAQRINYLDNFWDLFLMLPRETARFVPRFIATLLIIKNPQKYGIDLPNPDPPLTFDTLQVNQPVKLSTLSQKLELEAETLASLNPELRYKATPEREYSLKIPLGYKEKTSEAIQKLSRWIPPQATYIIHYVRRGETVSGIARRHRTSISAIARLNRMRRNYLIRPGQRLKIPAPGRRVVLTPRSFNLTKDKEDLIYTVKQGDSLHLIAAAFSTTIKKIKEQNKLSGNILTVGQKLVIQAGVPEGTQLYTVKTGDTPYSIAKAYGMKLSQFLKLNRLRSRSRIYPGQKLRVLSTDNP